MVIGNDSQGGSSRAGVLSVANISESFGLSVDGQNLSPSSAMVMFG